MIPTMWKKPRGQTRRPVSRGCVFGEASRDIGAGEGFLASSVRCGSSSHAGARSPHAFRHHCRNCSSWWIARSPRTRSPRPRARSRRATSRATVRSERASVAFATPADALQGRSSVIDAGSDGGAESRDEQAVQPPGSNGRASVDETRRNRRRWSSVVVRAANNADESSPFEFPSYRAAR
jgi:hypothetical protein